MLDEALAAGGIGLSSGLEYQPGCYADVDELAALATVVARHDGVYATHIRNRGERFAAATREAIEVARRGDVRLQLSHFAPRPYAPAQETAAARAAVDELAESGQPVWVDTFPEIWGPGLLMDLFPREVAAGTPEQVLSRLRDRAVQDRVEDWFARGENFLVRAAGYERIYISSSPTHPEHNGRALTELAAGAGTTVAGYACAALLEAGEAFPAIGIRHVYATEDDLRELLRLPYCSLGSDGVVTCGEGQRLPISVECLVVRLCRADSRALRARARAVQPRGRRASPGCAAGAGHGAARPRHARRRERRRRRRARSSPRGRSHHARGHGPPSGGNRSRARRRHPRRQRRADDGSASRRRGARGMSSAVGAAALEHCRALVRMDTSNPGATEEPAARYVVDTLASAGLSCDVVEPEPGRCSVVARVPGREAKLPPLLVHGHLDVVPAQDHGWTHDPFGAVEADGCLWGRGALDMKAAVGAMLAAQTELAARGGARRTLVFAYFADEEMGGVLGSRWIADQRPELLDGVTEAIGEVGGFTIHLPGGRRLYPIQCGEKGMLWLRIVATGPAGHAALTRVPNPVVRIAELVGRIAQLRLDEEPPRAHSALLDVAAEMLGTSGEDALDALGELGSLARLGAATRFVPTVLAAGGKVNVVPDRAELIVDCRFVPGQERQAESAVAALLEPGETIEVLVRSPGVEAPPDGPLYDACAARREAHRPRRPRAAVRPGRRQRRAEPRPPRHPRLWVSAAAATARGSTEFRGCFTRRTSASPSSRSPGARRRSRRCSPTSRDQPT